MTPNRYEDITVEQWQYSDNVVKLDKDKFFRQIDLVVYFTGKSVEEVENMDSILFFSYANKLDFLFHDITPMPIVNKFKINGIDFIPTDSLQKMKVNQMVDYTEILKANSNSICQSLHMILPIVFCKAKGYEPDKHAEYVELFKKAKLGDVLGAVFFYTDYWQRVERITQHSMEKSVQLIQERMNEISQMNLMEIS
jgi:hypothetical protein